MNYSDSTQQCVVDAICEELPSDDNWDKNIAIQRGYIKAGLKRYKIDHAMLTTRVSMEGSSERICSSTQKNEKEKALTDSSCSVQIKVEHPFHMKLQAEHKVLASAEKQITSLLTQLRKDAATLKAKSHPDCARLRCSSMLSRTCVGPCTRVYII
jgi:hypothetical protein